MSHSVFTRSDRLYFIRALAEGNHSDLDLIDTLLEIRTRGGNMTVRATAIVEDIFEGRSAPDELVMEVLNAEFHEGSGSGFRREREQFKKLKTKVLDGAGVVYDEDDGFHFEGEGDVADLPTDPLAPVREILAEVSKAGSIPNRPKRKGPAVPLPTTPPTPPTIQSNKIFLVRGRDQRPVDAMETYLHFLGLSVMDWKGARTLAKNTQPHTYDIVLAGITNAAAVIVIFSPDEEARLKDGFLNGDTPQSLEGQARPNVILEAGMAYALFPERTIFVKSGETRNISDIDGFNWISMDGSWDERAKLRDTLRDKTPAEVNQHDEQLDHRLAGPFKVAESAESD